MTRRPSRTGGERGIALVEFAIILPVLLMLSLATIEAGFGFLDKNVLARAIPQAARIGAGEADGDYADYEVLRSLDSTLSGLRASSLSRVIVFDATTTSAPPASCLAQTPLDSSAVGVPGQCNVYSAAQVGTDDPTRFSGGCTGWDTNWCPTTRNRLGDDPDRIGVWVELDFDRISSYLPGSITMTETAVFQLEPCVAGDSSC